MIISGLIQSLFLTMGLYLRACHLHYESMLQNMSELVGNHQDTIDSDAIPLKAHLIDAISLHNQAKE